MIPKHLTLRLLALMVTTGTIPPLAAQTPASDEVVTLDEFTVTEVPIEENILPSSRPFGSVYGTSRNVLDTPRNVTIISRAQLDAIGVLETRDFSKLTASSYTQTNFGLPSNPSIRGQPADVLVNGMRKGLTVNGNGMPVNFNSVESINIVKGTGNVLYGATTYTGGYADFVTKKPYFDKFQGEAKVTIGSFDTYRWTVDAGGPLSEKFAYRVSYSGEDSVGYYENGKKKTQAIYGAIEYRPNDRYTVEANAEFFVADVTENWGINRVTQDLIDRGLYLPDAGSDADYAAAIQNIGGAFNPVRPSGTPVKLDRRKRLLAPGDDSYGINISSQVIQTLKIGADNRISNNTFFNYVDRDTFSSYYYNSIHKDNFGIENRLQYEGAFDDTHDKSHKYAVGLSLRHQQVWAVDDFWHEPVNSFDLTRDPNLNRVPASAFGDNIAAEPPFNNFNPAILVPGYGPRGILPGRYATPGATYGFDPATGNVYVYGDLSSNDSTLNQISPFYQHDFTFNDKLSFTAGVRMDFSYIENRDPLPPPGFERVSDSTSIVQPSYNFSTIYKIRPKITTYYTFAYTQTTRAGALGGGYTFTGVDFGGDGRSFTDAFFEQDNILNEVGVKTSLLNDTLFVNGSLYSQNRFWHTDDGKNRWLKSQGFELEANYQPNRNFFATASYSYFDSRQRFTGFLADAFPYDQNTGGVTPNFPSIDEPFQQPGMPEHLFNFLVGYKFDSGFGFNVGAVVTGPMVTSQEGNGTINFGTTPVRLSANEIPWQYSVDSSVFYTFDAFTVRLTVRNLTDEENWSAPNPGYGNGSINAELPVNAELSIAYKF